MRRLPRILLNAATVLSLLVGTASLGMWAAGMLGEGTGHNWTRGNRFYRAGYDRGLLYIQNMSLSALPRPAFRTYGGLGIRLVDDGGWETWHFAMHCAYPAGVSLAAFVFCRKASSRMPPSGHCPTCGYDLRATPDCCPECGTVPVKIAAKSN